MLIHSLIHNAKSWKPSSCALVCKEKKEAWNKMCDLLINSTHNSRVHTRSIVEYQKYGRLLPSFQDLFTFIYVYVCLPAGLSLCEGTRGLEKKPQILGIWAASGWELVEVGARNQTSSRTEFALSCQAAHPASYPVFLS